MHKADTFTERRQSKLWKMPAIQAWSAAAVALVITGNALPIANSSDLDPWVIDASGAACIAALICVVICVVICNRAFESVMRAVNAANKAAGLPDPGEPAELDHRRKAA
jgi:membrane protein YdbS with pleckstrin-like domain